MSIRSILRGRGLRGAAIAGVMAATLASTGTALAGTGAGLGLNSSYTRVSAAKANGGTLQHINGTSAFAIYVNVG